METIEKTVEVAVPLSTAYNQWTQFEEFPKFMEGIESVTQLDDKRLRWKARIGGHEKEWTAEIFEQIPDRRIAWRSTSGAMNSGMVNFTALNASSTRVALKLNYDPEGAVENLADALGLVSARVGGDLERFKKFIEQRGRETGAWTGQIEGRQVTPSGQDRAGGVSPAKPEARSKRIRSTADDI
ncbi:MAG: Cyclase/dehydrase [Verrucomicrobiales bacterium]|nr:Cyclase/dehydrase [Verrucomicrobiales bacterium]MDB6131346.1 Cyclase/dehydrase [Verrucomicrobiales bacterium]